ncbi:AAA family ATPase [Leptolyngbya sp. 7M]|uniref:AAA family ATPase n=1 Tax=Leptolyngbya sp. 7M TaxID=2812896 RepID=UPI0021F0DC37|nr:AAA family ATPase [Leptolyngbya sp. 7M]
MYIKRVELTNFKSFGGTTEVPLLPGFTVISGPNGSGKSNILDALLFALGLSSSKGMRAERLPDLVNQTQASRGRSMVEASVTVTFALDAEDVQRVLESEEEEDKRLQSVGTESNGHESNGHEQLKRISTVHCRPQKIIYGNQLAWEVAERSPIAGLDLAQKLLTSSRLPR